jgi:hypothetical protein
MTEHRTIKVVCDSSEHAREKTATVATFSYDKDNNECQWAVVGQTAARRPSKPGKPARVLYVLGPRGYLGGKLRCKRCGEIVPPVSLDSLNGLVAQGVSIRTIRQLRVLASKQQ